VVGSDLEMSARAAWDPVDDFRNVRMVDKRHARRVVAVAERALAAPQASFPRMMRDDGELEGAYRLFSNPNVSPQAILDAHFDATAERALSSDAPIVVAHDSSDCCFGGEVGRDGIGRVNNDGKGLSIHVALAMAPDGTPHGLLDLTTRTRLKSVDSKRTREKRPPWQRESARWVEGIKRVGRRFGEARREVHVADREADSYLLFEELVRTGRAFVIRICQNRRILDHQHDFLRDAIEEVDMVVQREVPLSSRSDHYRRIGAKKTHPARKARVTRLAVGARTITIPCPRRNRPHAERISLTLNVVRVWEPNPPAGEAPVEWLLITNLPIASAAQQEAVVDVYRLRWTIEEFFKALKTGCSFERRQLESRHALDNALAILAPIACRMLLLRTLARVRADAPASEVLTPAELAVLQVISARFTLPRRPTVREALFAVAGLGGFLKRNGEPGWQTIGLGFEQLLQAELIWKAAKQANSSDQ
jgi:hypothetical protein